MKTMVRIWLTSDNLWQFNCMACNYYPGVYSMLSDLFMALGSHLVDEAHEIAEVLWRDIK